MLVALLLANCVTVGWSAVRGWLLVPSAVFLGGRYLLIISQLCDSWVVSSVMHGC